MVLHAIQSGIPEVRSFIPIFVLCNLLGDCRSSMSRSDAGEYESVETRLRCCNLNCSQVIYSRSEDEFTFVALSGTLVSGVLSLASEGAAFVGSTDVKGIGVAPKACLADDACFSSILVRCRWLCLGMYL